MRMMISAKRPSTLSLAFTVQDHALAGRPDASTRQEIQLSGLGIHSEHAAMDMDNNVNVTQLDGARTCIIGSERREIRKVSYGNRLFCDNNFSQLKCPRVANRPNRAEPERKIDYDFAQQELMENELVNDTNQDIQNKDVKQEALEKQGHMYKHQMQTLHNQLRSQPSTSRDPNQLFHPSRLTRSGSQHGTKNKYQRWTQEREMMFKESLVKLKEEVKKANVLVRDANILAQEMGDLTAFHVTLQIPVTSLSPNKKRGASMSEPAILVTRKNSSSQVWSVEKLDNKLIGMREAHAIRKENCAPTKDLDLPVVGDPFYESEENHNLIGVANIFLKCLSHDVKLDHHVPIINQHGEVTGKLHIEISKLGGAVLDHFVDRVATNDDGNSVPKRAPLLIRFCIKEARELPLALSNFVFCQYSFWGEPLSCIVPPEINPDCLTQRDDHTISFVFNHEKYIQVPITQEFIEHCSDGALSIEVWGHRSQGFGKELVTKDTVHARSRYMADRWNEVMRKIEFWAEIYEQNDHGNYTPVEVVPKPDVPCAGIMQLRQGHSRLVRVRFRTIPNSGNLPLICESISSLAIGCVCVRTSQQKGLDSYQEEDLTVLRDHWSKALARRKKYLDEQIQKLVNKQDKSESDCERERALVEQWVCLMEEHNAVLLASPGSSIPGAPANWSPPPNLEEHSPVIFLDLNADNISAPNSKEGLQAVGINSILPKEQSTDFVELHVIKSYTDNSSMCALASWDSSCHDSAHLNRVTADNEHIYMIVKAVVRLSYPAAIELVLRKRICINIYKKHGLSSFTSMLKNRIITPEHLRASGVTYEVVSNLPKGSEDLEDMETLAQMAVSQNEISVVDGESYIERYIKGVSVVESVLTLDRLRQEVTVKELLTKSDHYGSSLRKAASVPNFNQFQADLIHELSWSLNEGNFNHSTKRCPSFNAELFHLRTNTKTVESLPGWAKVPSQWKWPLLGLTTPKSLQSPLSSVRKTIIKPMRTVLEEQQGKSLLRKRDENKNCAEDNSGHTIRCPHPLVNSCSMDSDDCQDSEPHQSQQMSRLPLTMTPSSMKNNSLAVLVKGCTPSITSNEYTSHTISTLTVPSEDSVSIRSTEEFAENGHQKHILFNTDNDELNENYPEGGVDRAVNIELCEQDKISGTIKKKSSGSVDGNGRLSSANFSLHIPVILASDTSEKWNDDLPNSRKESRGDEKPEESDLMIAENDEKGGKIEHLVEGICAEGVLYSNCDLYRPNVIKELAKLRVGNEKDAETIDCIRFSKPGMKVPDAKKPTPRLKSIQGNGRQSISSSISVVDPRKDKSTRSRNIVVKASSVLSFSLSTQSRGKMVHSEKGIISEGNNKVMSSSRHKRSGLRSYALSVGVSPQPEVITRAWQEEGECSTAGNRLEEHLPGNEDAMSECSFGSTADLDLLSNGPLPVWIQNGEIVTVISSKGLPKSGVVRFVGTVQFAGGVWIGVELDQAEGKNDGSVKGVHYFQCRANHGVFVRCDKLMLSKKRKNSRKGATPLNRRSLPGLNKPLRDLPSAGGNSVSSYMRSTASSSLKKI